MNDCHSGACGGHLSGMDTTQKILCVGYFCPLIFKECHEAVKKFPPFQLFYPKKHTHPTPLHPIIVVGHFSKWGIDFMHCKPTSTRGHGYIIVVVDYFTKWDQAMPTYAEDGNTVTLFVFNNTIARFGFLQAIVTDHGSHFHNQMMAKLSPKLGFLYENSTPYYP